VILPRDSVLAVVRELLDDRDRLAVVERQYYDAAAEVRHLKLEVEFLRDVLRDAKAQLMAAKAQGGAL
jgi:hypothetical protein